MDVKIIAIVISLAVFFFVIDLIRREKLTFQYALSWIIAALLALFFSVFDKILFVISDFFGFELASNFVFFALLAVFVFMSLLLTIFLSQQSRRNEAIAQKLAVLEFKLHQVQENQIKD